eukprot:TRINITY_DN14010_c0_g1_i1.p1 TRINITY_DN14010_c0_g1~~TRINITY_DN14010_c0_g1_i1.p1  ORF type:complete len:1755 (-),score=433.27 TRINITY_DN14010_c0_g1_i1:30-5294(-)
MLQVVPHDPLQAVIGQADDHCAELPEKPPRPARAKTAELIEQGIFGVVHTMVKDNAMFAKIDFSVVVIDFFQLIAFAFATEIPIHPSLNWWRSFTLFFQLASLHDTYDIYIRYFIATVALITIAVADSVYVAYAFQKRKFNRLWPIQLLRFLVAIMVTLLFIPLLHILIVGLECEMEADHHHPGSYIWVHALPPHPLCGEMPHRIVMALCIIFLVIFVLCSIMFSTIYFDPDPLGHDTLSRPGSRLDAFYLVCMTVISCVDILLHKYLVARLTVLLFVTLFMTCYTAVVLPYYKFRSNQLRCALFAVTAFTSVFGFINYALWTQTSVAAAACYYVGIVPVFALGWKLPIMRQNRLVILPVLRRRDADSRRTSILPSPRDQELDEYAAWELPRLWFATDVEVATRFLQYRRDASALTFAERIYQQGEAQFPKSAYVRMCHANFLVNYTEETAKAGEIMKLTAANHKPPFDLRFLIFSRGMDLERATVSNTLGQQTEVDVIGFVEFQKNYKLAKHYHQEALERIQVFWRLLLKNDIDLTQLAQVAQRIEIAQKRCTEAYTKLSDRFPNSKKVMRNFGRFLEVVKNDQEGAQKYYAHAHALEESEKRTKAQQKKKRKGHHRKNSSAFARKRSGVDLMSDMSQRTLSGRGKSPNKSPKSQDMFSFRFSNGPIITRTTSDTHSALEVITTANTQENSQLSTHSALSPRRSLMFDLPETMVSSADVTEANSEWTTQLNTEVGTQAASPRGEHPPMMNRLFQLRLEEPNTNSLVSVASSGSATDDEEGEDHGEEDHGEEATYTETDTIALLKKDESQAGGSKTGSQPSNSSFSRKMRKYRRVGTSNEVVTDKLLMYFWVSFVVLLVLAIGTFVTAYMMMHLSGSNVEYTALASERRFYTISLQMYARALVTAATVNDPKRPISFSEASTGLQIYGQLLRDAHRTLYQAAQANSAAGLLRDLDLTSRISLSSFVPGAMMYNSRLVGLWDAGNVLAAAAMSLSQLTLAEAANAVNISSDYHTIVDNTMYGVLPAMDTAVTYWEQLAADYRWTSAVNVTLLVVTIVMVFMVGLFLFRPLFSRIQEERNMTLNMFLQIPPNVINRLLRKLQLEKGVEDDSDENSDEKNSQGSKEEDDRQNEELMLLKERQAALEPDTQSQKSNDRSQKSGDRSQKSGGTGVSQLKDNRIANARHSRGLFEQLTMKYLIGLFLIAVMAVVAFAVLEIYIPVMIRPSREINVSGQRSRVAREIHLNARELQVSAAASDSALRANITILLRSLETLTTDLRFGSTTSQLKGVDHRAAGMDALNYEDDCLKLDATQCLNDTVNYYETPCGLVCLLGQFTDEAFMLANTATDLKRWNNTHLQFLTNIELDDLYGGLADAQDQLLSEHSDNRQRVIRDMAIILGATLSVMIVIFLWLFRPMVTQVTQESARTLSMLMMIPTETIESVPAIRRFLMRGDRSARALHNLLREKEDDSSRHLDGEKCATIITDDRSRIEFVNLEAARLFGCTPLEMLGSDIVQYIPEPPGFNIDNYIDGEDDDRMELPHHLLLPGQRIVRGQHVLQGRCKDGSVVNLLVDASEVQTGNKQGRLLTVVIFLEMESKQKGPQVTISLPTDPMADADEFNKFAFQQRRFSMPADRQHVDGSDEDDDGIRFGDSPRGARRGDSDTDTDTDSIASDRARTMRQTRRASLAYAAQGMAAPISAVADATPSDQQRSGSADSSELLMKPLTQVTEMQRLNIKRIVSFHGDEDSDGSGSGFGQ